MDGSNTQRVDECAYVQATSRKSSRGRADFRREVVKQAAYTLLNRIVILRLMEAMGLHEAALGYREPEQYSLLGEEEGTHATAQRRDGLEEGGPHATAQRRNGATEYWRFIQAHLNIAP